MKKIAVLIGLLILGLMFMYMPKLETIFPKDGNEFSTQRIVDGYVTITIEEDVINISDDDLSLTSAREDQPEQITLLRFTNGNVFVIYAALHTH